MREGSPPEGISRRVLLALAAGALACTRRREPPAGGVGPGVRNAHALAYDGRRGRLVLFGGASAEQVLGDLWVRDGVRWTPLSATGPSPRTFPAMAFDPARGRLVLFGGNRVLFGSEPRQDTLLADTWEWTGEAWQRIDGSGPPPRAEAGAAFDEQRGRFVLFGGQGWVGGTRHRFGDTWELDGRRWMQVADSGPAGRSGTALAFDAGRGVSVLFGGSAGRGPFAETWEWDGSTWSQASPGPSPRFNPAMAYDTERRELVCFGGWNGRERTGETWVRRGDRWRVAAARGPLARNHAAMAFDGRRRQVVLFGGHDGEQVFGDLWAWDGQTWQCVEAPPQRLRVDNGH